MKPIRLEEVAQQAAEFEKDNGAPPTHILMTVEQQDELSDYMRPKEKVALGGSGDNSLGKVTVIHATDKAILDILAVAASRTGSTNSLDYPALLNLAPKTQTQKGEGDGV